MGKPVWPTAKDRTYTWKETYELGKPTYAIYQVDMDHYMTLGKGHSQLTHDAGWDTSMRGAE